MKLDKTLNFKKVRCVKTCGGCLTAGKEYSVLDIRMEIKVKDDEDEDCYWESDRFEPVIDELSKSAENPPQKMELTPEFEAVEPVLADNSVNIQDVGTDILDTNADIKDTPKFKVGDLVYRYGETDVKTVLEVFENGYMRISNYPYRVNHETLCHATPKNHAVLSKPFPAIEFEQPPKPDAAERPMTLIEKLEQEVNRLLELKAQEKPHSLGYVFLGHHIAATVNAINIVKQHEAESEVQDD